MQYRKIDWHDWERIAEESKRIGPGEQGQPIQLVGEEEHSKSQKSFQGNGFSGFVSDKIALDRAIKDIRNPLYAPMMISQRSIKRVQIFSGAKAKSTSVICPESASLSPFTTSTGQR